jgi:phosphatidylserine decarboxylase
MSESSEIYYYRRDNGELCREAVLSEGMIKFAYQQVGGRGPASLVFRHSWASRLLSVYFKSRFSRGRVQRTIDQLDIDPSVFRDAVDTFASFNDFFTRHLNLEYRPFDAAPTALVSPADGRVLVYPSLEGNTIIPAKGRPYTVDELLLDDAGAFHDGAAIVIRLCPADYHRFHFPCDGRIVDDRQIPGVYHSVNPVALAIGLKIFCENRRCYSLLDTPQFGRVAMIEIGAFGVGSIVWTFEDTSVKKMQERGYFEFGGSTIVLLLEHGQVRLDPDLIEHSANGFETLVHVGETIGTALDK